MDVREKLVELINDGRGCPDNGGPFDEERCKQCRYLADKDCDLTRLADYLIAHGVTVQEDCKACAEATQNCIVKLQEQIAELRSVQEWISVKDRLPELHTKVLCCGKKGGRFIAELGTWGHERHLYWDKKNGSGCPEVTHWMPLPQPPKGE